MVYDETFEESVYRLCLELDKRFPHDLDSITRAVAFVRNGEPRISRKATAVKLVRISNVSI